MSSGSIRVMGTKVKGFFKGLKNISNIFDEGEKEEEIQIGMPTDVKHVAHIGADGPAIESPSWMKEFDAGKSQSGPLEERPYIQKGANNHRISRSEELTIPEKPKTNRHRHHRSIDSDSDSQSSTKKHTRRHRIRRSKDKGDESSRLPDIPKKSRRRKPKDDDVSVKSSQSQDTASSCSEPPSDL
ncbi:hypothetical protein L2E82_13014 [Cichorium intybus]|uniref:Uncharacterized protein n=1 Tax=Cichorium intybus TaxID=13427 RepID=A0ACB9GIF0_CICIN|nr:hypothetical protein L2E82_13014 [Cichorium intybus]